MQTSKTVRTDKVINVDLFNTRGFAREFLLDIFAEWKDREFKEVDYKIDQQGFFFFETRLESDRYPLARHAEETEHINKTGENIVLMVTVQFQETAKARDAVRAILVQYLGEPTA